MERRCVLCDKILVKDQKKFCSLSCAAKVNNIGKSRVSKKSKENCLQCGEECKTLAAKYCSNMCQAEYRRSILIDRWKNGLESGCLDSGRVASAIRVYIWKKYDSKCARCGWCEIHSKLGYPPLEIEHIDGDWTNCKEENLILLCPNCHALTDTYRALNRRSKDRKVKGQRKSIV